MLPTRHRLRQAGQLGREYQRRRGRTIPDVAGYLDRLTFDRLTFDRVAQLGLIYEVGRSSPAQPPRAYRQTRYGSAQNARCPRMAGARPVIRAVRPPEGGGRAFQLPGRAGEVALAGRVDAEVRAQARGVPRPGPWPSGSSPSPASSRGSRRPGPRSGRRKSATPASRAAGRAAPRPPPAGQARHRGRPQQPASRPPGRSGSPASPRPSAAHG